ncbi:uncharacterized protein PG998_002982 [Apiospora kogelbergensis]|uniref:uncharacterized protein n=1 Tax=Apiospora kogelbergensis TaxID=1337665 RepID=UPI00312FCEEA
MSLRRQVTSSELTMYKDNHHRHPSGNFEMQASVIPYPAGVGDRDGYAADLPSNFLPKNTNSGAIDGTVKLIKQAASQCPDSNILLAGYSQGSAVMTNAIQALGAQTKNQVKGVVMYGFTRNAQDKGQVPGYPQNQTKVFCAAGDLVCVNTLNITPAHLTYGVNAPAATRFLAGTVKN